MVLQDQKSGYTFSLKKKSLLGNQGQIIQNVSVYIPYLKKKKFLTMLFILKSIYKINPGTNNIKLRYLNKLCRYYGKQVVFKNFEFVISDTHTIIT